VIIHITLLYFKCIPNNVVRLPASGPQAQPYSTSLPSSSGGVASQTHTYRTGSPAGSQSSKIPQPLWSARMPTRGLSASGLLLSNHVGKSCMLIVCIMNTKAG